MKIPTQLEDFEIKFLKKRGFIITFPKYPNNEEFNKSILIYAYIPTFGIFLIDDEENKQYKLTEEDVPKFLVNDFHDWLKFDKKINE